MIYELRTYTLRPGTMNDYQALHRDVGRKVRGDKWGKLVGGWTAEFGTLNQYVHLWTYEDPNERESLRREMAKDSAWNDYLARVRPYYLAQENKILQRVESVPFASPAGGSNVYELRTYRVQPGQAGAWVANFTAALPARERYSKIVGLWASEVGQLNEVVHLWSYADLNERTAARAKLAQDADWNAYLAKNMPLLQEQKSVILVPTATSPLQ